MKDWHDVIPLAKVVYERNCMGCCAHVILDDGNYEQHFADSGLVYAREKGHPDCIALLDALAKCSNTQRRKLYREGGFR